MMLKITNNCAEGCKHCLSDCKPGNDAMITFDILDDFLNFVNEFESKLKMQNLIVTGGEPTEHPDFVKIVQTLCEDRRLQNKFNAVTVATNGFWVVENYEQAQFMIAHSPLPLIFQCSTDSRFYNRELPAHKRVWRERNIEYCPDCVQMLTPMGRAKELYDKGVNMPVHQAPSCFNIRAVAKQLHESYSAYRLSEIILFLEAHFKFCTPSANWDGSVSFGESSLCPKAFWMKDETDKSAFEKLLCYKCDNCAWMMENLPQKYKDLF